MLQQSPIQTAASCSCEAPAAGLPEPNAMVLTTRGRGAARADRVLKAHDDDGFTFYTNRTSRKGRDLAADPRCCALLPWYGLGRQVTSKDRAAAAARRRATCYHSRPGCRRSARGRRGSVPCSRRAPISTTGWRSCPRGGRRAPRSRCRFLGRVPDRAGPGRVLAVPAEPAPRPAQLPPRRGSWVIERYHPRHKKRRSS